MEDDQPDCERETAILARKLMDAMPLFCVEEEMRLRPKGWPLPRPAAIHHSIEDFLTEWDAPVSHIQPIRRFFEHCVQTDLRSFYAGTVELYSCSGVCV